MELLQLQYFVKVARLGSMTKAAHELHVSQPSLSQTMRRLENEMGVKLFEKNGRQIKMTAQGQKFYSHISFALQEITNAANEAKNLNIQGNIVLGSYLSLQPIIPALEEFASVNPDITFTFLRISDLTYVNSQNMDALLCYEQSDGLNFRERLYITSSERVIIAPYRVLSEPENPQFHLQELKQEPFVSLQWDNDRIEEIFDEFTHHNFIPNVRYRTNSALFKQELMESGLAVGFSNSLLASQLHQTGKYIQAAHAPQTAPIKIFLAWRSADARSPATEEFKKFMTEKFAGQ